MKSSYIKGFKKIFFLILVLKSTLVFAEVNNSISPISYFIGREKETAQVKSYLNGNKTLITITGFTGVGKTQLLRKVLQDESKNFDVVWWFNCKSDVSLQAKLLLEELIKSSIDRNAGKNKDKYIDTVLDLINEKSLKTVFLYDDFEYKTSCVDTIKKARQYNNLTQVIISQTQEENEYNVHINFFNEEEARRFLLKRLKEKNISSIKLDKLARLLSYHPLALEQAVSFLNQNPNFSVDLYVQNLERKNIELLKASYSTPAFSEGYQASLAYAINKSLEKVKELNPSSYKLLEYIAYMDNKYISNGLLKVLFKSTEKNPSNIDYFNASSLLTRYSLINVIKKESSMIKEKDFTTHEFIQLMLLDKGDEVIHRDNIKQLMKALLEFLRQEEQLTAGYDTEHLKLIPTIERLLELSKKYKQYTTERFSLATFLVSYYTYIAQYSKMPKIFSSIDKEIASDQYDFTTDEMKIYLIDYYISKATYYDSGISDYKKSLEELEKARDLVQQVKYSEQTISTKYYYYLSLAQINLYAGHLLKAEENLMHIEKEILQDNQNSMVEPLLSHLYFIKAKLALENNKYEESKKYISECINIVNRKHGYNIFTFPVYLLEAEIDFRSGDFKNAYDKTYKLYIDLNQSSEQERQLKARILTLLSSLEIQKNELDMAEKHIPEAINILKAEYIGNEKLLEINDDFAQAYVVAGDLEKAKKNYLKAMELYVKAYNMDQC